ncbi:MAG TPA: hypothetical protein VM282_03150 [Acidimicrobiales bacterium]|nr:hypothetical protein [Acidimicrobiales bacterium]
MKIERSIPRKWLAVAIGSALWLSACGDDGSTADTAREAAGEIDDAVDAGIARGQAEIFRQRAKDLVRQGESLDSMSVLQEAARDLPRSPTVTGLSDTNGDGRDDDGKVQIEVDDSFACVVVTGTDIDVSSTRC